jgi:pimeloyl-ACP methyl ester carboxylesterase
MLRLIQLYFQITSVIAPRKAARFGFKVFQKVRIKSVRNREKAFFEMAKHAKVSFESEDIDLYELGDPKGDLVFLIHGWESNAGSLSKVADELVSRNKRVIAFNLPGHAFYKNDSTNLFVCKKAFEAVLAHVKPTAFFSTISHSFGSAVTANALSNTTYPIKNMVFLTSPNLVEEIFIEFAAHVKMGKKAHSHLLEITRGVLGKDISSLDVERNLAQTPFRKLLILHDRKDKVLPFSNSERIAQKVERTKLLALEGNGHYKMLWSDEVVKAAVDFV